MEKHEHPANSVDRDLAKSAVENVLNRFDVFEDKQTIHLLLFMLVQFELEHNGITEEWECYTFETTRDLTLACIEYWKKYHNCYW